MVLTSLLVPWSWSERSQVWSLSRVKHSIKALCFVFCKWKLMFSLTCSLMEKRMSLFLRPLLYIVNQYNTTVSESFFKAVIDQSCLREHWHLKAWLCCYVCGFKRRSPASLLATEKTRSVSWSDWELISLVYCCCLLHHCFAIPAQLQVPRQGRTTGSWKVQGRGLMLLAAMLSRST